MKYEETNIIYNKVKETSGLTDAALSLLGATKDKIDAAIHSCVSKGMSRQHAMRTVYNLWKNASPDVQASPPTLFEMTLMGFEWKDGTWVHMDYPITLTAEEQLTKSFKEIEDMVLSKKNKTE